MHKIILTLISFICFSFPSLGQVIGSSYISRYKYFSVEEDLPTSSLNSTLQHSDGSIWVGSNNGLYHYNGHVFNHFGSEAGFDLLSIASLSEDKEGNLWVLAKTMGAPQGVLYHFDITQGKAQRLIELIPEAATIEEYHLVTTLSDYQYNIWIHTTQFLFKWDGERFKKLPSNNIQYTDIWIYPDGEDRAWIFNARKSNGPHSELWHVEEGRVIEKHICPDSLHVLTASGQPGPPLFASQHWLYRGHQKAQLLAVPLPEQALSLGSISGQIAWTTAKDLRQVFFTDTLGRKIGSLKTDIYLARDEHPYRHNHQHTIWIPSGKGQVVGIELQPTPFKKIIYNLPTSLGYYASRGIWSNDTLLYVAGLTQSYRVNLNTNEKQGFGEEVYPTKLGLALMKDRQGNIWTVNEFWQIIKHQPEENITTVYEYSKSAYDSLREQGLLLTMQWALHEDAQGKIWVGHRNGLSFLDTVAKQLIYYNPPQEFEILSKSVVYAIHENTEGLWLGTNHGLFLLGKGEKVKAHYDAKSELNIPETTILHIEEGTDGSFWLSTNSQGLLHWHPSKGLIAQYTDHEGLPSSTIYASFLDGFGYLWGSSLKGLFRLQLNTGDVNIYLPENGITHQEFNTISAFRSASGQLYFGGLNGITSFHPKDFVNDSNQDKEQLCYVIKVNIQNGETGEWKKTSIQNNSIEVPSSSIGFEILFAHNPSLLAEKALYSYKLAGENTEWQYSTEQLIRLSQLPYGQHQILIRAEDALGNWTSPTSLNIEVLPPFYLRTWFLLSTAFLILITAFLAYKWQQRRYQRIQEQLELQVAQRTQKIQEQAESLQLLNAAQSRFFANISHELRTPLTLIFSPLQDMMANFQQYSPAKNEQRLKGIYDNSQKLMKLIEEILDFSKLENKQMRPLIEPCPAKEYFTLIALPFIEQSKYQQYEFHLAIDLEDDLVLILDVDKVKKIIDNLLSNAIKYTSGKGEIQMDVRSVEGRLEVRISDTGIGISDQDLPHIFERFYQIETAQKYVGSGIGLSFAKELTELIGGTLKVRSELGKGSVFTLTLPQISGALVTSKEDTLLVDDLSLVNDAPLADIRIILAEDHPEMREFVHSLLSPFYEVIVAANGEEAWELLQQEGSKVSLIVSDVMMPKLDGFGLLQRVRQSQGVEAIPFLLLTALSSSQHRIEGYATGVDDYLTKPFSPKELLVRVKNLLVRYQTRKALFNEPAQDSDELVAVEEGELSVQDWKWLKTVESYMREKVANKNFSIDDLAYETHLSTRQFRRKLKLLTGLSPLHYYREIKLEVAKELLEDAGGDTTVSQVALKVGFEKASYFSKLSQERFGKSPMEMRLSAQRYF